MIVKLRECLFKALIAACFSDLWRSDRQEDLCADGDPHRCSRLHRVRHRLPLHRPVRGEPPGA